MSAGHLIHFVTEHRAQMARLLADPDIPHWRAMDLAIGANVLHNAENAARRLALAVNLSPDTKVLDVGCGYGNTLRALPLVDYTGLDIVPELLEVARATRWHCPTRWVLNADYTLPFAECAFDVACAFSVFSHLYLHEVAVYLAELHRVLKPGGTLVFTFWERDQEGWRQFAKTVQYLRTGVIMPPNTMMSRDEASNLAIAAGFGKVAFVPSTPHDPGPFNQTTARVQRKES